MPWVGNTFELVRDFVVDRDSGPPDSRISAEKVMEVLTDIAQAFSEVMTINGESQAAADLDMGGFKVINLDDGENQTDSVTVGQAVRGLDWVGSIGGTSTRYTVSHATGPDAPVTGLKISGVASVTNGASLVISYKSGVDIPVKTRFGATLVPGDIPAGSIATFRFVSGEWRVESITPSDVISGGGTVDFSAYPLRMLQISETGTLEPLVPGTTGVLAVDADGTTSVIELYSESETGTSITFSPILGDDGEPVGTISQLVISGAGLAPTYTRAGVI